MAGKLLFIGYIAFTMTVLPVCGFCLRADEVISKAKEAMASLSSVKTKGQTITGGIDVTDEQSVIDYRRGLYYSIDKKNQKIITTVYCEKGITYINEMFTGAWFQFPPGVGFAGNMFNQQTLFNLFPDDTAGTGLNITFAGNETLNRELCHRIQSNIFNRELAKLYIQKSLEKFVPRHIAAALRNNPQMLDDYLNVYTQNLKATLWVSQDTFLVKKLQMTYNQIVGPGESVSVQRDVEYYDFNKQVRITIPEQAYNAKRVSLQDLGFQ